MVPATPNTQRLSPMTCIRFRLIPVRSPLLGESRLFSFLPVTKMFQFTGLPPGTLCIQVLVTGLLRRGCPIRKSADQGLFAAPRSLSQLVASFFGHLYQGIHHALFVALPIFLIDFSANLFTRTTVSSPKICRRQACCKSWLGLLSFRQNFIQDLIFTDLCSCQGTRVVPSGEGD